MRNIIINRSGVSIIAAVFIIVILAFMGLMFVTLIGTGSLSSVNDLQSSQALYIAEGGLENASLLLNTSTLADRIACANVNANLNAMNLGQGQFTVTVPNGPNNPFYSLNAVTLTAAIAAGSTVIPVGPLANLGNYDLSGRVVIDREAIDYGGQGTTVAACNPVAPPCLISVVRGRDGTVATSHANGARLGQYQCTVTSTGGVPDLTTPAAQRAIREGIQLQEGWVVGGGGLPTENLNSVFCTAANNCWAVGNAGTIINWNGVGWGEVVSPTGENLNEVHCSDANNCWAVGNAGGVAAERPLFLRWDGAAWAIFNSGLNINEDLNGVSCSAPDYCWAVGTPGGTNPRQPLLLNWRAGAWGAYDSSAINIAATLNSVDVIPTWKSWAVGERLGNGANDWFFVRRTAGALGGWSRIAVTTAGIGAQNLNSVSMIAGVPPDGWAVGNRIANTANGWTFFQWNDGADIWNRVAVTTAGTNAQNLNDVFMIPGAAEGWAVGNRIGAVTNGWILLRYNAGAWARVVVNTPGVNAENLNSVTCTADNDCWAVGDAGMILRWNGANWALWQQADATLLRWRDVAWSDAVGMLPVTVNRLRSVSMLSYADVWAAGDRRGCGPAGPTIVRWNGAAWACTTGALATPDQNLRSIFMVSSADGWAVGNRTGATTNGWVFLRWNGAGWNQFAVNTAPAVAQNLNSVFMLDTDNNGTAEAGWAAGNRRSCINPGPTILRWDGANWACPAGLLPATADQNLNGIFMLSMTDGWSVGNSNGVRPVVLRWNTNCNGVGATGVWNDCTNAAFVPAVNENLNSVYMLSATDGWAVGNSNGVRPVVFRWNANCNGVGATGAWNNCTNAPYVPAVNADLNAVLMLSARDGWAAGDGGVLLHWDGTTWAQIAIPIGQNLDSVSIIGPRQRPQAAWQEVVQ